MISSAFPASNLGSSVRLPPLAIVAFRPQVRPKTWKSGRQPMTTSPGLACSMVAAVSSALRVRFAYVSSAPFGLPVVPEVYRWFPRYRGSPPHPRRPDPRPGEPAGRSHGPRHPAAASSSVPGRPGAKPGAHHDRWPLVGTRNSDSPARLQQGDPVNAAYCIMPPDSRKRQACSSTFPGCDALQEHGRRKAGPDSAGLGGDHPGSDFLPCMQPRR
jgi:hypothetical protein